jgi:Response regulator containing a CheY-like receiver domain and an HTH DNA-binding domain
MIDIIKKRGKNEADWGDKFLFFARRWPLYIDAYDKDYACIFWNQEAERISGYSAKEMEGNPEAYSLLYPDPEQRERLLNTIKLRGYDFNMAEWPLTAKNGEKKNVYCVNISKLFQPFPHWDHWSIGMDLTPLLQAEHDLERRNRELTEHSRRLNELNIALKVLLEKQQTEKQELREDFIKDQNELVLPFLEKLQKTPLDSQQKALLEIAVENIRTNIRAHRGPLDSIRGRLTITEFEVATFISRGKSTLEISEMMNLAPYTVATHRNNIRRKLGLVRKGVNLAVYLRSAFKPSTQAEARPET